MASKKGVIPDRIPPQLVNLVGRPPPGEWLYEIKLDGYRLMARLDGAVALITKNGHDWTSRMPMLAQDLARLPVRGAWVDGEIVMLDGEGRPAFQPLQAAFSQRQTDALVYYAFDLVAADGKDLRPLPLLQRKAILRDLLEGADPVLRYSEHFELAGDTMLSQVCSLGAEGIVSKRRDRHYASGRSGDWLKAKCANRQEFVVAGYVPSSTSRKAIGSLILGYYRDDALVHAGRVGTGLYSDRIGRGNAYVINGLVSAVCLFLTPTVMESGNVTLLFLVIGVAFWQYGGGLSLMPAWTGRIPHHCGRWHPRFQPCRRPTVTTSRHPASHRPGAHGVRRRSPR